jgi:hypothetical protein
MFFLKLSLMLLAVNSAWTLTAIEDRFLTNELMDYFEDDVIDISIEPAHQKRHVADVSSGENMSAGLVNKNILSRANHYWTRKRGRESTTNNPYPMYPNTLYGYNPYNNFGRRRRAALKEVEVLGSRDKREAEDEVADNDGGETTDSDTENPTAAVKGNQEDQSESQKLLPRGKNGERKKGQRQQGKFTMKM